MDHFARTLHLQEERKKDLGHSASKLTPYNQSATAKIEGKGRQRNWKSKKLVWEAPLSCLLLLSSSMSLAGESWYISLFSFPFFSFQGVLIFTRYTRKKTGNLLKPCNNRWRLISGMQNLWVLSLCFAHPINL